MTTLLSKPPGQTVQVNGVELYYDLYRAETGDIIPAQPPVVLLHGWPETSHAWHRVVPELTAKGFTVITPDLRGLGRSGRPASGYDVRTVAEDIHLLVAQLGFEQIDLVGHDVGAWVSYAYAAAYPQEIRRLVLADAGLPGLSPEAGALVSTAVNVKTWHFPFNTLPGLPEILIEGREDVYMRWLFENKAFTPGAVSAEDLAIYTQAYQRPGAMTAGFAFYRDIFESARQNKEYAKTKLTMPVLALGGETGVGPALLKKLQELATDVSGEVLAGCGHYLPDEKPKEFAGLLLSFLTGEHVHPALVDPSSAPNGIPTLRGVDHTGLNVPDLDAAVAFFTDVLGAQLLWEVGPLGGGDMMIERYGVDPQLRVRLAMLRVGASCNVELLQYLNPEGQPPGLEEPANSELSVGHLAFLVADINAAAQYLQGRGLRLFAGPNLDAAGPKAGEKHQYFLTPWGSSLELVARPDHLPYEQTTTTRLFVPAPTTPQAK